MSQPIVLFRRSLAEPGEYATCSKYFNITQSRLACHRSLVIGRYSCLPYYKELEQDLSFNRCVLINTYKQHQWIADFRYYEFLKDYTPETWFDDDFYKCTYSGPFVVKGKTNSRKNNWKQLMFAPTKRDALEIARLLLQDSAIGEQGVIYRKYVPLETYEIGIGGIPITNEWRFFFFKQELLASGYYWSTAENTDRIIDEDGVKFAKEVAKEAAKFATFFVLDIAKTEEGNWILIEVNDGQQSGLSEVDAELLYKNLSKCFN